MRGKAFGLLSGRARTFRGVAMDFSMFSIFLYFSIFFLENTVRAQEFLVFSASDAKNPKSSSRPGDDFLDDFWEMIFK